MPRKPKSIGRLHFKEYIERCERKYLEHALALCDYNIEALAEFTGLSRSNAFRKVKYYKLKTKD